MPEKNLNVDDLRKRYEEMFRQEWANEPRREEILEMVGRNTEGGLWIIGGFVYRSIIKGVYGNDTRKNSGFIDIDFLATKLVSHKTVYIPEGWELKFTTYQNPFLETEGYRVDLNSLHNYKSLLERGFVTPELRDKLNTTPLDIQSIAWDCTRDSLIGDKGILAIHNKKIEVNDFWSLQRVVRDMRLEPTRSNMESLLREKAGDLGFDFVFNDNESVNSNPQDSKSRNFFLTKIL